jgi:HD superfamily phosphohydrolase
MDFEGNDIAQGGQGLIPGLRAAAESEADTDETTAPEQLRIQKMIRIAVSGDVFLTRLERQIIDTRDFQRLRGIRQLGLVSMVYPTALHTRFDHSLGTLAMADRMIHAIRKNSHSSEKESEIKAIDEALIRIYALLHDITHIPFGHTIEDELRLLQRHDKNNARIERFLGKNSEIGQLIIANLGLEPYQRLIAIYRWDGKDNSVPDEDAYIYDIVSNTLCADLLDYLARDSYFCSLGIAFEYRFLNFLYLHRDADNRRRVFIRLWKNDKPTPRRDTLTDLVRLLEARYQVAERAYFHHAKLIAGAMLGRAFQEAHSVGEVAEDTIYQHTDETLLRELATSTNPLAGKLGLALIERRLYKRLIHFVEADFAGPQEHSHDFDARKYAESLVDQPLIRRGCEDELATVAEADAGDVLIYAPPPTMNLKVARMKVLWKGIPVEFQKIDDPVIAPRLEQVLRAHEMLWGVHIFVNPNLQEDQLRIIKKAASFIFCHHHDRDERRDFSLALIDYRLKTRGVAPPGDLYERREKAVAELLADASDNRPWGIRVDEILAKHFPRGGR